jgi:streptogramin lyase
MSNRRHARKSARRQMRPLAASLRFRPRLEALEDRTVPAVTEFPILTPASGPRDIVQGSDGNFWFTEFDADRIGRITQAGVVTEFTLAAGTGPDSIVSGPDGRLWFTERFNDTIGRLNPNAGSSAAIQASIVEFSVPGAGSAPKDITVGPDGALWFTEIGLDEVGRITTAGVVTNEFVVPGAGSAPDGITAGPDGALWFTELTSDQIGRITTAGVVTEFNLALGRNPNSIAAGPDGALWFTEAGVDKIGRITTGGAVTNEFPLFNGSLPQGIIAGGDGRLYFAETGRDRIGRISTTGVLAELGADMTPGAAPSAVALNGTGFITFTEQLGSRIGRAALTSAPITATATGGAIAVFNGNGGLIRVLTPFGPRFHGPLAVAVGDVNGDGIPDIITTQANARTHIVLTFNGATGVLHSAFAFPGFAGGVSVAAGDINGDGRADIFVGVDSGRVVAAFTGGGTLLRVFPGFAGGVRVASGDVNGDGFADILVTPAKGPAFVAVFSGKTGALHSAFFPLGPRFRGNLSLAAGDVNGDGRSDVIVGLASKGPPVAAAFSSNGQLLGSPFAYPGFNGGVAIGAAHFNGDGFADIVAAPFTGKPGLVEIQSGNHSGLLTAYVTFGGSLVGGFALAAGEADVAVPVTVPTPVVTPITNPDSFSFSQARLQDLYVFRSPANANNTVFMLTTNVFAGNLLPFTFDPNKTYAFNIDSSGDAVQDIRYLYKFSAPDANPIGQLGGAPGQNYVAVRIDNTGDLLAARGRTNINVPVQGGGTLRVGLLDDPFFFDKGAFNTLVTTGAGFPRAPGAAHNFFGPNVNVLAVVMEVNSNRLPIPLNNPNKIIGVWATEDVRGVQIDRVGKPFIVDGLIPPVPRSAPPPQTEQRLAFLVGVPSNDVAAFRAGMIAVLVNPTGFYKRTMADASFLADALLPDMLFFQLGNPNGFGTTIGPGPGFFTGPFNGGQQVLGNGRRFADDVIDILLNILTNGVIPGDNVGDDNGLKVTDGSVDPVSGKTRAIAFPYSGLANLPLNGPGTGPNP